MQTQPTHTEITAAAEAILAACTGVKPRLGVILGSGLAPVADQVEGRKATPYSEIPGFPAPTAPGHKGRLVSGKIGGVSAVVMQGRFHLYEGYPPSVWLLPIRAMREAGVEVLVITNAVGGLRNDWPAPGLVLVRDHINGLAGNPLTGQNDPTWGVRFPDMTKVYPEELRAAMRESASSLGIRLDEGVYYAMHGPCFETPAEIHAMRVMGADVVGMSLVPEAIVAHHCGIRLAAVSVVTNPAAGLNPNPLTEQEVLDGSAQMAERVGQLLEGFAARVLG